MEITLKDGTILEGVPEGTTQEQAQAHFDSKYGTSKVRAPDTATDVGHSALGGLSNAVGDFATTPAKAVVGLAGMVNRGVNSLTGGDTGEDTLNDLAGKVRNLDSTIKGGLPDTGYVPQTTAGRWASAGTGGVATGVLSGSPTNAVRNGLIGAAAGGAGELAAQNNAGPGMATIASMLPNLLMAGKSVVLPNKALLAVKGASTPDELSAALALMRDRNSGPTTVPVPPGPNGPERPLQVPNIPITPGQAFPPDAAGRPHQMEGIQNSLLSNPKSGSALQAQLRQQAADMGAALAPGQPFKNLYDAAGTTPASSADAISLAVALGRAAKAGNPSGPQMAATDTLANAPLYNDPKVAGFSPVTNLSGVQNIRDRITNAPAANTSDAPSAIPVKSQQAMREAASDFLRTKDGRFAAADTAAEQLLTNKAETLRGTQGMGSSAMGTPGAASSLPVMAARATGIGTLAAVPAIADVIKGRQAAALAKVFSDTTGQSLLNASQYSPGNNALSELARALLQARTAGDTGSGQGL